jgi:rod shape-determining protein MreC
MRARTEAIFRFAAPLRAALYRFAFLSLVAAAFLLLLLSKAEVTLLERARMALTDALEPVFSALSRPAEAANDLAADVGSLFHLRDENERLRHEIQRLAGWHDAARRLDAENQALRGLLNFHPDHAATLRSARVIADSGGAFMRSLLVSAGSDSGVAKGQAAMTGDGLIGRVMEIGDVTARILLLTDLNSRIPIVVERTRDRAVLAGDNTAMPRLLYLPQDSVIYPGDRVVTSGQGGSMPPGLPIGVVASVGERGVQVTPFADWGRIEYVQLVDFTPVLAAPAPLPAPPPPLPIPPIVITGGRR